MHMMALARLADLRLRQGRLDEAEGLLEVIDDERASALPEAAVRLSRGEPDVAAALLQRRLNFLSENCTENALMLELLVQAHIAQGNIAAAAAVLERLRNLAATLHDRAPIAARAVSASARVSLAQGNLEEAARLFEEALEWFLRLDLPLETARIRLELARTQAAGNSTVAVALARRAQVAFEQLGASTDSDTAAAFLRSLGAKGRTGPKNIGVLTKREQDVLRLIGFGLSNPEVAQRLLISRKTAAHHVSSVLAKLGLRNRAEAVAYATRTLGEPAQENDP
jgi:DNA-binding NarL/FixJ family response regulator